MNVSDTASPFSLGNMTIDVPISELYWLKLPNATAPFLIQHNFTSLSSKTPFTPQCGMYICICQFNPIIQCTTMNSY